MFRAACANWISLFAASSGRRLSHWFLLSSLIWLGALVEATRGDDPPAPPPEGHPVRSFWDPWKGSFRFIGGVIILLTALVVPMLLYDRFKYSPGAAQVRGELARLAASEPHFAWQTIRQRIEQAVKKFYDVRSTVDLSPVSKLFTPELLAREQGVLKQCDKEGRQLVRRLTKLRRIEPLAVALEDDRSPSAIRAVVRFDRVQYQRDQYTLEIVDGAADPQLNVEEVWTLIYNGRKWVIHDLCPASNAGGWPELPSRTPAAAVVDSAPPPPRISLDDAAAEGVGDSTSA